MTHFIFTGGGTGGHLYPALATADALRKLDPGVQVLFVGTPDRLEARVVPEAGYPFFAIAAKGLSKKPLQALGALALLSLAVWRAYRLLGVEKPLAVLGTGGYVSAPVCLAARLRGIPVVLQEQNVMPGKVNRWIAHWAHTVAVAFEASARYLPKRKLLVIGNPIRLEALSMPKAAALESLGLPDAKRLLLVTGGSQGAERMNASLIALLPRLLQQEEWTILHVAGSEKLAAVQSLTSAFAHHPRYKLVGYLEGLPKAVAAADLVLTRAGATTLAEATAVGKPMVIVPYPYAGGHQRLNAEAIVEGNAGIEVPDGELTAERLGEALLPLMNDSVQREAMASASRSLGRPDAALDLASLLLKFRK